MSLCRRLPWFDVHPAQDRGVRPANMLCGLVIEPRFGAVVLNGLPGMLQFYQFEQDRQLAEVRLSGATCHRVNA